MNQAKLVLALFLGASAIAGVFEWTRSARPQSLQIDFDNVEFGEIPTGWKIDATHPKGMMAEWSVQKQARAPSGDRVLAVRINDFDRGTFNLCWTDQINFQNGVIEVKVRAGEGRIDQGGGPIWRVKDKDNYYVARWNPLENNFRVYYVKKGKRVQLDSTKVILPSHQWHTINIHHQANQIRGYLNGEKLLGANDSTFPEAGGVGLWTKADAASSFDDLEIRSQ